MLPQPARSERTVQETGTVIVGHEGQGHLHGALLRGSAALRTGQTLEHCSSTYLFRPLPIRSEPHVAGNLVSMSVPAPAATKARRMLGEVARFLAVGGLATAVSFLGFNALVHGLFLGAAPLSRLPILAFVLANFAAGWVAYVGMRTWAFQERGISDPVVGLVRFFTLGALTMIIPVVCLSVSRYVLGLSSPVADNVSANVVGLSLGAAARFWVFRTYVFDQATTPEPAMGHGRA